MRQKGILTLTDAAANRLKQLRLEGDGKNNFRLGVKSRGCNGMSYTLDYADKPDKFEDVVHDKDVTIFITPQASMSVIGTLMDYHDDKLRSEFIFENPNATATCGCGESFTTDNVEKKP